MNKLSQIVFFLLLCSCFGFGQAAGIVTGAAPKGDPNIVAKRVIKTNFPACGIVAKAARLADGTIRAQCGRDQFRVFTVFNAKEGKTRELAMNCTAMKAKLNISCF